MKEEVDFTFKAEGDHLLVTRREEWREESLGYDVHRIHSVLKLAD